MGKALVTGPTLDPVSLAEAKAHCRVFISEDDGLLVGYLLAARQHVEIELRRPLISQTWDYFIDHDWPREKINGDWHRRITLPLPPLQSVTSISYVDASGSTQTLAVDQYRVSKNRHEGVIEPAYGVTWPSVRDQVDAITVRFVCGYGSSPSDVPEPIRQAILLLVGHWYENRETVNVANMTEMPFAVQALLFPFRVFY